MKDAASYMTRLDFSHLCDYRAKDELGDFASSLNFLASSLNDTIGQLNEANRKLQKDLDVQKEIERFRKEFISSVSHEFKTPLTLLRGYVEMMKDHRLPETEMQEAEETMIAEIDKLDRMVQELLELSCLESETYELKRSSFDVDELLREIAQRCVPVFQEKNRELCLECHAGYSEVYADRVRIEQVITNFLSNALKNTVEGGRIVLASENMEDEVEISVFNEGQHIEEDDMQRIWEPSYMADRSRNRKRGGTGLGLSICREALKNMGVALGLGKNFTNGAEKRISREELLTTGSFLFFIPEK